MFNKTGVKKLDKYEYNLKLEEIDKLVDQKDYKEAADLADTIDWRRVRNVRTLCLISEIYEAADRPEDSKTLLVRAYRKSPVGRTVLYRLIEVTTKLGQYDEALEYFSEYVQLAPHDNNRYILKYQIYRGRGSQKEELISILEEYLGQEYTERWAYELATLYQQTGQMQKCLATCDDLVLWFHSGKYVRKALELKKRYAALTPKQQQIYEEELQEEQAEAQAEEPMEETIIQNVESTDGEVLAETIMAQTEKEIADQVTAHKAELERAGELKAAAPAQEEPAAEAQPEEAPVKEEPTAADTDAREITPDEVAPDPDPEALHAEFAKSMRKIIAGVVKRTEDNEEDIPASVEPRIQEVPKLQMPEQIEQVAGQLSIDDILLSMSDQGRRVADAVIGGAAEEETAAQDAETNLPEQLIAEESKDTPLTARTITEAATDELTDAQREALQYTNHPERLLRNRKSLPTYAEEAPEDELGKTRKIVNTKEELMEAAKQEILSEKTIRIPTEQIFRQLEETAAGQEDPAEEEQVSSISEAEELTAEEPEVEENTEQQTADTEDVTEEAPAQEPEQTPEAPVSPEAQELTGEEPEDDTDYFDEPENQEPLLTIPEHLRDLFGGFTAVEGLEDQIANAILQIQAKGTDRTSRSGNILIFGAHASGKTTLAMNIAKAVAQEKGSQTMKIARIYAADLNRKDIAATIAKIAGGTLIIEEAGDLEAGTVEQLTTAMEFRTDGLIIILEDEQQYIHELLMQHPRFTMKFTAQIYIPVYNVEELAGFGQIYANAQDYMIGEEAYIVLKEKIAQAQEAGAVSIADVIEIVSKAIARSNKFFRKISMGKKRYDANDYVVLFPKDIK